MSKAFVLLKCEPDRISDVMRSLAALKREDKNMGVAEIAPSLNNRRYHIMITLRLEGGHEFLNLRLASLKKIGGVSEAMLWGLSGA